MLGRTRDRLLNSSTNGRLLGWINFLYRAGAEIESGSTGDAIRYEVGGGSLLNSSNHLQKAKEALNGMRDLLLGNKGALNEGDKKNIFEIIGDLTKGTGLTWKGIHYDYLLDKEIKGKK